MNLDKASNMNIFKELISNNETYLAEKLIMEDGCSFENWEDGDCQWIDGTGINGHGTIWKSTAKWIVKVTKGVKACENALYHAEQILEDYEKEEEEQRIFQSKIDGTYDYCKEEIGEGY